MRRGRQGLRALATAAILLVIPACSSGEDSEGRNKADGKVEVLSWWMGSGGREGFNDLINHFKENNPSVTFTSTAVSGGIGNNSTSATRSDNKSFDSYQAHAGWELKRDIRDGKIAALDHLYSTHKWKEKIPKGLVDAITVDGKIHSVPISVYRTNLIWYNPKTLAAAGIASPPKVWSDFLSQAAVLRQKGITPLSLGPMWTQKQLLETVLLGELGAESYTGLWNGKTDWRSPSVVAALAMATKVFANSDISTAATDWQPMMDKVISGGAAYTVMGDWAYTYNVNLKNIKYKIDFDVSVSPGSEGIYDFFSDSFTLIKGARNPGAAQKWLIECGSATGQNLFNSTNGSVPVRIDADASKYTDYLAQAVAEWRNPNTAIVGSLAHGVVVSSSLNAELDAFVKKFLGDSDAGAFADAFTKAYRADV